MRIYTIFGDFICLHVRRRSQKNRKKRRSLSHDTTSLLIARKLYRKYFHRHEDFSFRRELLTRQRRTVIQCSVAGGDGKN